MKVLVATNQTQGERSDDFNDCIEGELVWIGTVCATDRSDPDGGGGCGCWRSFAGMNSHQATTTVRVADVGIDFPHYAEALRSSLKVQGRPTRDAITMAGELADLADGFPIGAVVERRLDAVRWRVPSAARGEQPHRDRFGPRRQGLLDGYTRILRYHRAGTLCAGKPRGGDRRPHRWPDRIYGIARARMPTRPTV